MQDFAGYSGKREVLSSHSSSVLHVHFRHTVVTSRASEDATNLRHSHSRAPYYIYGNEPPTNFSDWVAFAKERGCMLEGYNRIEEDLQPFRGSGITKQMIQVTSCIF